jgi:hypothetical protein
VRIEEGLARRIACEVFAEPYRQVEPMTTRELVRWLSERGLRLRWETIHHLWVLGVLHPIVVLEPALASMPRGAARFAQIDVGIDAATYVDLGQVVSDDADLATDFAPLSPYGKDSGTNKVPRVPAVVMRAMVVRCWWGGRTPARRA